MPFCQKQRNPGLIFLKIVLRHIIPVAVALEIPIGTPACFYFKYILFCIGYTYANEKNMSYYTSTSAITSLSHSYQGIGITD